MPKATHWKPEGARTLTPYLTIDGAAAALEFYKQVLGAEELARSGMPGTDKLMHAEMRIGDSMFMLSDEFPGMGPPSPKRLGGSPCKYFIYVPDVDAAFRRAVEAGATAKMPPGDMFWGDRMAEVTDPFGHTWDFISHIKDVPPEEMTRRVQEVAKQMGGDHSA